MNPQPLAPPHLHRGVDTVSAAYTTPCQENDPELWFSERPSDLELAKSLCRSCPLRHHCLDGALQRHEPCGVWGGEIFVDGAVVAHKRGRGRPRKQPTAA